MIDAGVLAVWSASPCVLRRRRACALTRRHPRPGLPERRRGVHEPDQSTRSIGGALSGFPALAKYFATQEKVKKVGILAAEINVAKLGANLTKDTLAEYGVTDVNQVDEQFGAADFSSAVAGVNDGDPDVIIVLFAADDCPRILEAAQQIGIQAKLAFAATCLDQTRVFDVAGEAAQGTYYESSVLPYSDAKSKDVRTFRKQLRKLAKAAPSFLPHGLLVGDDAAGLGDTGGRGLDHAGELTSSSSRRPPASRSSPTPSTPPARVPRSPRRCRTPPIASCASTARSFVDVGGGWVDGWDA